MRHDSRTSDRLRSASQVRYGRRKFAGSRDRLRLLLAPLEDRVVLSSPSLTSTPGGTVVLGSGLKMTDSVTLSGGTSPTGSILFTLTSPGASGTTVETERVTANGDGSYSTANGYLPEATGTYEWAASYSGDINNGAGAGVFGRGGRPGEPVAGDDTHWPISPEKSGA